MGNTCEIPCVGRKTGVKQLVRGFKASLMTSSCTGWLGTTRLFERLGGLSEPGVESSAACEASNETSEATSTLGATRSAGFLACFWPFEEVLQAFGHLNGLRAGSAHPICAPSSAGTSAASGTRSCSEKQ